MLIILLVYNSLFTAGMPVFETAIQRSISRVKDVTLVGNLIHSGILVSIPEGSLSPEEEVDLLIRPCSSGPFELPAGYEPASPAYLITTTRNVKFCKDLTIKIHHYASLESQEDCDQMVFLSAEQIPVNGKSGPVYVFEEIEQSKGKFNANSEIGEIALRHFSLLKIARKVKGIINNYSVQGVRDQAVHNWAGFMFTQAHSTMQLFILVYFFC